ncbi:unnamed protein product [Rotaria sordida]|uniref:CENP-V/GFA domain-containing protein n=1 Tax=Rotaria sordida TaxID=392033 RepID=A0A819Z3V1_9BILA|nr:unnamed protein product [Rotaria sordida]CAF4162868.1 unnamed protein product [Rotaria sordida]
MSETTRTSSLTGGCQYGMIRYVVYGLPVKNVNVCHCRMCQKAMGNIFGIFAEFRSEDVSWTRGTPSKFRSSSYGYRLFCSMCGTPLAFMPADQTKTEITVGSLDQSIALAPEEQIGIESRLPWTSTLLELPAKTTQENNATSINIINYQHPDHETATPEWLNM